MRTLYAGAGLALTAGLLMGATMKPQLVTDGRPAGPQIFAGWSAEQPTGPFDDGFVYASYSGQIPDYVLGTDLQKMMALPVAMYEPQQAEEDYYEAPAYDDLPEPAVAERHAVYAVQASERVAIPSLDGGAAYEDASRAEKTPLVAYDPVDIDAEAPPEATGDTTPAR